MKTYRGIRHPVTTMINGERGVGVRADVVVEDGPISRFLVVPSDINEFDWGRSGLSPARLARCLIRDALPDLTEQAHLWFTDCFYHDIVVRLGLTWTMSQEDIVVWYQREKQKALDAASRAVMEMRL